MQMEALKRTAGRPTKINSPPVVENLYDKDRLTANQIGSQNGDSHEQVRRYIRLNRRMNRQKFEKHSLLELQGNMLDR